MKQDVQTLACVCMFLWSTLIHVAQTGTLDIKIIPTVQRFTVGVGMRVIIRCSVTAHDAPAEPDIEWNIPADAHCNITKSSSEQDGNITVYKNIIFEAFSKQDVGLYTCFCKANASFHVESTIQLIAGCPRGKYGKECINCNQHCLLPTDIHTSPCDLTNGNCALGCKDGYTGKRCSSRKVPLSSTSNIPHHRQTTTSTTVTKPSVPATTIVTTSKSTVSQTSPDAYIIVGTIALLIIGVITFCACRRRQNISKWFGNLNLCNKRQDDVEEPVELNEICKDPERCTDAEPGDQLIDPRENIS